MSSSRDHSNSIFIQITRQNAISEILEGWQYWLDLGLISEEGVPARLVGGNDSFHVNFKTTLNITNIIQQLRLLEEVDSFNDGAKITFSVKISASDPFLLQGLDRWVQLGLLTDKQIKDIARKDLSFPVVIIPRKTETLNPVNTSSNSSLPIPKSQTSKSSKKRQKATNSPPHSQVINSSKKRQKATNSPPHSQGDRVRKKTRKTPRITQIVQSLMAELSVIWLLLLGVFMVVISSGVIAASWWERFPAILQYGILWSYTLGFGFASWWTGKKANLQLTTQGLLIVTLLLVPINFLAMDTFRLWDRDLGLVGILVGSLSLTRLTISFFKENNRSSSNSLPLLNHLGLTYLHWGWTFPVIPLLATYIGVIGTTIITLISPKNSSKNNHKLLPFSLSEGIIIYALIILLVRAIFIAQINLFQLSLAIGICGWLMGWRSPPQTGWKLIGSGLLTLGWLLSIFVIPSHAIAISLLAIIWLGRRLKYSGSRRDFFIIFLIGLQIHWLLLRVAIFKPIWSNIIDFTNTSNHHFVLSSIILFPYLFIVVLVRHFLLKKLKIKLYNFSGELLFLFGFILTAISFINPLVRTVNLTLSTLTLAYETRHKLKNNRPFLLKPLALITHISLLLSLTSGINYFFPELSINIWSLIFLGLMLIELLVSLITFPEQSLLQLFNNNSWNIGLSLATLSYVILWFYFPLNSVFWGLSWLIVPSLLTAIATWYLPRKKQASELSVIAICLLQALTIYFPETQLIGLVTGTVLMIINTQYLRHLYSVIITVGLGLTAIFSYLYFLGLSHSLLLLSGVIITLLLWFIRHILHDNTSDLTFTYAQIFDGYAYILSTIILTRLIDVSLVYTSTTNTLISSIILMGSVAYRSWQPLIRNNRIPLLYSIVILAVVPIPALSLPLWGWIELGIATILMVVQTRVFKQVDVAFISIGFILEFIVVVLEDNGLKYAEQFWIYWSLLAAVITILFWIIYHALNYFQVHSIDYYKKALNLWAISLCTVTVGTITVGRLTSDYLLNNDLILLITINLLMIGAAYRSWQKPQQNSLLWFSIVITLILQLSNPNILIPKNITPIIGTILLFINSYFLPHFSTAFITMGMAIFSHSLIVLTVTQILELPTIPIWILTESLNLIILWLIWTYLKQKTQVLATIYAKVVDTWGLILSGVLLVAISIDRLTIYSLINNDLFLLITINLLMIGTAYRSWQKPKQERLLWLSSIIILMLQFFNPNLLTIKIITPITGTILLFINSYFLPHFLTAFMTVGMAIFCRSIVGLKIIEIFKLSTIPIWILTESLTLILFWLIWSYLKQNTQTLATIYSKVFDTCAIILSGFILAALTLHSIAIYWGYTTPSVLVIITILLLFSGLLYRTIKQPNNLIFYTFGWSLELLTINITTKFSESLFLLAIVNIILGILLQLIGKWWQRRTGERQFLSSLHILPLLYGGLGTALRYNSFNSLTGFTFLGFGLIIIGFVRDKRSLKPLIYLGISFISFSAYELLFYQITNFSWGDKYLSMAALATTIMYVYRLASPWLSSYFYLIPRELKIIAHSHWILGSICLGLSLLYSPVSQQLLGLSVGLFLTQYAILEGRNLLDKIKGEMWVYLGFMQAGVTSIYGFSIFPPTFLSNTIGAIFSLFSIVVYTLPWRQWGWSKRPWNLLAFTLPLMGVISDFNSLTLLVASISYAMLAKLSNKSRLFYLSLLFINCAAYNYINQFNQLSPLLYSSLLCLSLLLLIVIEPYFQGEARKSLRHSLRIIATGILGTVSLLFYQQTGIIPGVIGLIFIIVGLGLKTRAFLFTGTITFLITVFYQLVIFSFTYPLLKWMFGLLLGLMFIWIAASFENRRTQINTIINHWIEEFDRWE